MAKNDSNILIIEDDATTQLYYATVLDEKYRLTMTHSAKEARVLLEKETYSLIIVDISLPGDEDGISLLKFLSKAFPQLPAIAITANAFPEHRSASLEAGADAFVSKPVMGHDLIDIVQKYIQKYE